MSRSLALTLLAVALFGIALGWLHPDMSEADRLVTSVCIGGGILAIIEAAKS